MSCSYSRLLSLRFPNTAPFWDYFLPLFTFVFKFVAVFLSFIENISGGRERNRRKFGYAFGGPGTTSTVLLFVFFFFFLKALRGVTK